MAAPRTGPLAVGLTKGDLYGVDANGNLERLPVGADGAALVADSAQALGLKYSGVGPFSTPQTDVFPVPATPGIAAQVSRAMPLLFEGGIYQLIQPALVNTFVFRATAQAGAPTFTIGIYQAADGGEGVAARVASATAFAIGGTGNFEAPFAEGNVNLVPGYFYLLDGRANAAGGTVSLRAYNVQDYDLINNNMPAVYPRPLSFTTATASTGALPATFDPRVSPTGAAIPNNTVNSMPVIRLRKA